MQIVSDLMDSNVFVVGDEHQCVIFDAGAQVEKVESAVHGRVVLGVFLTHGHYDHCYYVRDYLNAFGCKAFCSEFAKVYMQNADYNYSNGNFQMDDFSDFVFLKGKGALNLSDMKIEYFQLGGHSQGDICFQVEKEIFVGDILIGRDMGRIDLFGGSKKEMKKSLQFLTDLNYCVMHCGHGNDCTKQSQDKVAKLWCKFLNR